MKPILPALAAALLAVSCAPSTPQHRIQQHPEKFAALDEKHKPLVEQGHLARGMTRDGVFLAWGPPAGVFEGSRSGKPTERWDYAVERPVHVTGFHGAYGYGYGPYWNRPYFGYGTETIYVPRRIASVWFSNHLVDSWERAR